MCNIDAEMFLFNFPDRDINFKMRLAYTKILIKVSTFAT